MKYNPRGVCGAEPFITRRWGGVWVGRAAALPTPRKILSTLLNPIINQSRLKEQLDGSIRASDVGRALHKYHSTIQSNRISVAWTNREMIIAQLLLWRDFCRSNPPIAAIHGRKYDSAAFANKQSPAMVVFIL